MQASFLALLLAASVSADIVNKCQRAGMFAMTWDDGPADYTSQLLDILQKKSVKITFHLSTQYLTDPNIQSMLQRISSQGHLIGLRTEPDWNLLEMSDDMIRAAVARSANTMANFIGYYPKFIRVPYNGCNERVKRAVESTGAIITQHNIESYDYTGNADRIYNSFQLSVSLKAPGSGNFISVQRDSIQASVGVAGKLIDLIKDSGYEIVTLDKCVGLGDMTKNKEALKGADGIKLPPLSGDIGSPIKNNPGVDSVGGSFGGKKDSGATGPAGGKMDGVTANAASSVSGSRLLLAVSLVIAAILSY